MCIRNTDDDGLVLRVNSRPAISSDIRYHIPAHDSRFSKHVLIDLIGEDPDYSSHELHSHKIHSHDIISRNTYKHDASDLCSCGAYSRSAYSCDLSPEDACSCGIRSRDVSTKTAPGIIIGGNSDLVEHVKAFIKGFFKVLQIEDDTKKFSDCVIAQLSNLESIIQLVIEIVKLYPDITSMATRLLALIGPIKSFIDQLTPCAQGAKQFAETLKSWLSSMDSKKIAFKMSLNQIVLSRFVFSVVHGFRTEEYALAGEGFGKFLLFIFTEV